VGKVAIVHDWLVSYGGAESVLEELLSLFPEADLYCMVDFLPPAKRAFLEKRNVTTSFVQRLPFAREKYRHYLPLMPFAVRQFDLSGYDLVLSSSHAVAKGARTAPDQLHICLCYTPMRYAWDMRDAYLRDSGLRGPSAWLADWMLHRLREWDLRTSGTVDHFIAISEFIAQRIRTAYRREATVIYPPVNVTAFSLRTDKEEFYLAASRLVPYKKIDVIVQAFASVPHRRLKVIGDGPELPRIRAIAGPNVEVLGYQEFDVLLDYMQRAKAFVFAAEEDFGIMPLEAQACGTPVIAFGKGACRETIRGTDTTYPSGIFFDAQTPESIVAALDKFESSSISPHACRENAMRFSRMRFRETFRNFVNGAITDRALVESADGDTEINRAA
jgi:glycosyltransferase involved in cell wall biosynthesis